MCPKCFENLKFCLKVGRKCLEAVFSQIINKMKSRAATFSYFQNIQLFPLKINSFIDDYFYFMFF